MPTSSHEMRLQNIVQTYEKGLLAYCLRILRNADDSQEVVQETFLRLCRFSDEEFERDISCKLAPWLYTVCRNLATDRLRRRGRTWNTESGTAPAVDSAPTALEQINTKEQIEKMRDALKTLTEREQEVIHLKFHAHLSYQQIAEVTGMSINHIGVTLHGAIRKMRTRMQPSSSND